MISLKYMLLAEDVNQEKDNRFSFINTFDKYAVDDLPTSIDSFYIIIGLTGAKSDDGQNLSLKIKGKHLTKDTFPIKYKYSNEISNYYIKVKDFPVSEVEKIIFELYFQNKVISTYPLIVYRKGD